MQLYCRLKQTKEAKDKVCAIVASQERPRLVAVCQRPLNSSLAHKFMTDSDLRDGLGLLKGVEFVEYDGVFLGQEREQQIFDEVFSPSLQNLFAGDNTLIVETVPNCQTLTNLWREMISRIIEELDGLRTSASNQPMVPSLRLFALGKKEYVDLLSRSTGNMVAMMTTTHLINKRSFEVFEDKIDTRFDAIKSEEVEAIILEVTVERNNKLCKFFWVTCSPTVEESSITFNSLCGKINTIRQSKQLDAEAKADAEKAKSSILKTMKCSILTTLSTKPEEATNNRASVGFLYQIDSDKITSSTHKEDTGSQPKTSRFISEEREVVSNQPGIDIHIKRNNENKTIQPSVEFPSKTVVNKKIERLLETYKSIRQDKDSSSVDLEFQERPLNSLSGVRSYDNLKSTGGRDHHYYQNNEQGFRRTPTGGFTTGNTGQTGNTVGQATGFGESPSGLGFNRQLMELHDYNKTLEGNVDTLKGELGGLVSKLKKEKKYRQAGDQRCLALETDMIKLKGDTDRLLSKQDKTISAEREKVYILETKLDECLGSNSDLRNRIGELECECCSLREKHCEDRTYIDSLRVESDTLHSTINELQRDGDEQQSKLEAALRKISELESQASDLKLTNKELKMKLENYDLTTQQNDKAMNQLTIKSDRFEKECRELAARDRDNIATIDQLHKDLEVLKLAHQQDVAEAESTIKNLLTKIKETEEEVKIVSEERITATEDIDDLLENIETLKSRLHKERKEKKQLEEDLKMLEKQINKQMKVAKRHVVEEIEEVETTCDRSRAYIPDSFEATHYIRSPKVEIIV